MTIYKAGVGFSGIYTVIWNVKTFDDILSGARYFDAIQIAREEATIERFLQKTNLIEMKKGECLF